MKAKSKPKKPSSSKTAPPFSEETKRAWLRSDPHAAYRRRDILGAVLAFRVRGGGARSTAGTRQTWQPHFAAQHPHGSRDRRRAGESRGAGMRLAALGEPGYPPLLARVEVPPPLLYIKGDASVWSRAPLAVVGSRQASAAGLKFASEISAALGQRGFFIVSGLRARHRCGSASGCTALCNLCRASRRPGHDLSARAREPCG